MEIDAKLPPREAYALMTSIIVPRAIALVSTQDRAGHTNLAPFSYFTGLGSDPPMVVLGIGNQRLRDPNDDGVKDTLRIARETGVFCVNLVEEDIAEEMNAASGVYAANVSEFDVTGLESAPCVAIAGVRVKASRASMECQLLDVHVYGRNRQSNLVVGEVLHFFLDDAVCARGEKTAVPDRLRPVARLGGENYAYLGQRFQLKRPS